MPRPITLFTGQWADLPFEEVARLAREWGYDGLEIACWGDHLDPWQGAEDDAYIQGKLDLLEKYGLKVFAISNHLKGQAVCDDPIDARHEAILSAKVWGDGDPEGVRQRAAEEMKLTARTAQRLGVDDGRRLHRLLDLEVRRDVPAGVGGDGGRRLPRLRGPLEPDPRRLRRVRRAVRARGAPLRDRLRLLDDRRHDGGDRPPRGVRPQLGPVSHFVWQDLDPVGFLWDFKDRIYHVDCKDAKRQVGNGRNGRLGSHLPWADPRRGWDFVSTGHGDVPWEQCFRMLNTIGYDGPISVEWEDAGMDRLLGAPEALEFVRRLAFDAPDGRLRRGVRDQGVTQSSRADRPGSTCTSRERKIVMCFGYDGEGALRRSLEEKGASRRSLLRGAAAGAAGAAVARERLAAPAAAHVVTAAGTAPGASVPHDRISIQLYTLRDAIDGRARLRHGAAPGSRSTATRRSSSPATTAAPPADPRPARRPRHPGVLEPRRDQRRRGGAAHQARERGDARAAVRHRALPQLRHSLSDWQTWADQMNAEAAVAKRYGLRYGYHNHAHEFTIDLGGGLTPWEVLTSGSTRSWCTSRSTSTGPTPVA